MQQHPKRSRRSLPDGWDEKATKEEKYKRIITEAYFALNGYSSPSLTRKQQKESLNRCYELLVNVVYGDHDGK